MDRIEKLRHGMVERHIDVALIFEPHNMYYMTGFTGGEGCAIITESKAYLTTDSRYTEQAQNESPGCEIVRVDNPANDLAGFIKGLHIKHVGFEEDFVSFKEYVNLKESLGEIELTPLNGLIEEIRQVKDEDEIKKMAKAQALAEEALTYVKSMIRPGITERELALELEFYIKKKGSSGLSFDTIVASGLRSSLPHGGPTDKKIEKGEFVTIDFGIVWDHYCSDMTRTYVVGEISDKQREIYDVVLEAQLTALEGTKAGMTGAEVDKLGRDVIAKHGYGDYFGHGLGHGVGLQIHELPMANRRGTQKLKENTILTCEPGIYIPDLGGVRIEDIFVIKNNGILNLTHIDKKLEIL